MPRHNPHKGLDPLVKEIEDRNDPRLGIAYTYAFHDIVPARLGPLRRLAEYVELAARIWALRRKETILVREFSTYFVFLTLLLIFPIRRKCLLLVAHNIQTAMHHPREKALLSLLSKLGLRFACLESDAGFEVLFGRRADAVFPHPVVAQNLGSKNSMDQFHIGVAGDIRPEKRLSFVLPILERLAAKDQTLRASVGTNKVAHAREIAGALDIVDTTDHRAYMSYLWGLDVLILPYPEETYRYRVSGVIAEATGMATPVICTDLPVLKAQVMMPDPAGVCLAYEAFTEKEIEQAIAQIKQDRTALETALYHNRAARDPSRIVDNLLTLLGRS